MILEMTKNKINIYINSKNYPKNSDIEVNLPASLIKCDPKREYIVLNVNGFIMKNEFYNTQKSNNKWSLKLLNLQDEILSTFVYQIPVGNYNVYQFLDILKPTLDDRGITMEYDSYINKYKFTNNLTNMKYIIKADTSFDFFGMEKNKEYLISNGASIYSENPINMAGDELVVLSIPNLQKKHPVLDDFSNGIMKDSDIICYLSINAPPFALLEYKNEDGGDSFSYVLQNKEIDKLRLICRNQDLEDIEVGDYQLNLQFEIHSKVSSYEILERILRLVSNIFMYLMRDVKN